MNKILLAIAAVFGIIILALAVVLIWNLSLPNTGVHSGPVSQVTEVAFQPSHTPYETLAPTKTPYATAAPTYTPWITPTVPAPAVESIQPSGDRFTYEGVSFANDPALMTAANGQVVPAVHAAEDVPFWDVSSEYVKLNLVGYPNGVAAQVPTIAVYSVDEYSAFSPQAAVEIANLKLLLAQKPDTYDQLPFLPVWNAVQSYRSNVKYLDFANGSGVRYLTLYAQYPAPVNNADLFYTFQGLTSDGRYVISVILPIDHPSLPTDADALGIENLQAIAQDYNNYRANMEKSLEAEPEDSFSPDLSRLDALMQSLAINK